MERAASEMFSFLSYMLKMNRVFGWFVDELMNSSRSSG